MSVYNCTYHTAEVNGSKLLGNTKVKKYIEERFNELKNSKIADANEVLEYFTRVMRGEEKDTLGFDASLKDRNKAGELLAKRYKLFEDKKEEKDEKNKVTPRIEIEVVDNSDLEAVMYKNREK
jgi:phage terminase small subunit